MTNGRGAGMASFMTKKKKYKFQVDVWLEELLEVPFVSAVLFAKLRLLDGGNFQDHSSRQEVKDHVVKWGKQYSFPCKMLANASTGVLERCVLRISVRKECKGGRSFTKLGFVDLNLAEYAGSGMTCKRALLEGYDARHRQDNSILKITIRMNMLSGDILFKAPSPSHKPVPTTDDAISVEPRMLDEISSGSLAGSIASGSSGFGSLPKKRTPLLSSDLVKGHSMLSESGVPVTLALDNCDLPAGGTNHTNVSSQTLPAANNNAMMNLNELAMANAAVNEEMTVGQQQASQQQQQHCEPPGHSRNSSNTSQMSKASGYSSIHTHSRQSSSGDSAGHISSKATTSAAGCSSTLRRGGPSNSSAAALTVSIPSTFAEHPRPSPIATPHQHNESDVFHTPQTSIVSDDKFFTPQQHSNGDPFGVVLRSKSDVEIPHHHYHSIPTHSPTNNQQNQRFFLQHLAAFLTPLTKRRLAHFDHSTPVNATGSGGGGGGGSRSPKTLSLGSLGKQQVMGGGGGGWGELLRHSNDTAAIHRSGIHRKYFVDGAATPTMTTSAPATTGMTSSSCDHELLLLVGGGGNSAMTTSSTADCCCPNSGGGIVVTRRPSVTQNLSSSSLVISETGSLDRAKAALERRKKNHHQPSIDGGEMVGGCVTGVTSGRVEGTRVNPDHLIDEIIKSTNLEPADDSAETSGLQLFIAKDGTASLGSHEVKSQLSSRVFKQVVMEDNR